MATCVYVCLCVCVCVYVCMCVCVYVCMCVCVCRSSVIGVFVVSSVVPLMVMLHRISISNFTCRPVN